jgi:SAM-dependent methyltransferase
MSAWKKQVALWLWPLRRHLPPLRGSRVTCPLCDESFGSFAPFGNPRRDNARCHRCGSLERHRWLWLFLRDHTDLLKGDHSLAVLHFAPERLLGERLCRCPHINYKAADLAPSFYNGRGVAVERMDVTNIPYPDGCFDVVLCNHVLEHVPDDVRAMGEIFRVLRAGGWAVLQVPTDPERDRTYEDFSITTEEGRTRAFGQKDHVRWYGRDYCVRLANVGFAVEEIAPEHRVAACDIRRFAIGNAGVIPLARKPLRKGSSSPPVT